MSQRSSESPFGTKITMEKCLSKHPSLLLGARASATKVCSLLTGQKKEKWCDKCLEQTESPRVQMRIFQTRPECRKYSVCSICPLLDKESVRHGILPNYMLRQSSAPLVRLVHKSRVWCTRPVRPEKAFLLRSNNYRRQHRHCPT